jgi:CMP-N-acetylneuraminic acid synthetase
MPEKNWREIAGRPLYTYILDTLHQVDKIELIVVDTDSPVLKQGISADYPQVLIIDRPENLRAGETPMNEVIQHDVGQIDSEFYIQTHSTNPLLKAATVQRALEQFQNKFPGNDSLFGVTELQTRLWNADGKPINHDPSQLLRTQDLPPVFEENSTLYIFERDTFIQSSNRIGSNPLLFTVPADEAIDIDNELDLELAEFLISRGDLS